MGENNSKKGRQVPDMALGTGSLSAAALALAALLWQPGTAMAEDAAPVRIATNVDRIYAEPMEALLRRAYAELGLTVEFVSLPLPRSLTEMRAGRIDAASLRSEGFFEQNPEMLKIGVPLMTMEVYAFGRPPCAPGIKPEDLRHRRVSYQRGSAALEQFAPPEGRLAVNTPADALLNVANGVSDYALLHGTPALASLLQEQPPQRLCGFPRPLASVPLYHALHPRLATRQLQLERTLAAMRERGEIDAAWSSFERAIATSRPRLQLLPGRSMLLNPAQAASGSAPARPPQ